MLSDVTDLPFTFDPDDLLVRAWQVSVVRLDEPLLDIQPPAAAVRIVLRGPRCGFLEDDPTATPATAPQIPFGVMFVGDVGFFTALGLRFDESATAPVVVPAMILRPPTLAPASEDIWMRHITAAFLNPDEPQETLYLDIEGPWLSECLATAGATTEAISYHKGFFLPKEMATDFARTFLWVARATQDAAQLGQLGIWTIN